MPMPGVLAGALSRKIKKGKLAILGRALPLVNNPLTIAEEYAILDNITRGRVIAGFVRGIGAEYHSMGVNPAESQCALPGGARSDRAGLDAARPVRVRGQVLQSALRQSVAAARTSSRIRRSGRRPRARSRPSAGRRRGATPIARRWRRSPWWRALSISTARKRTRPGIRPRPTSSPGRTRSMSPRPTRRRGARRGRISRRTASFLKMNPVMMSPPGYSSIEFGEALRAAWGARGRRRRTISSTWAR